MSGFGGMLSFSVKGGLEAIKLFLPKLQFAHMAANLGCVETGVTKAMFQYTGTPPEALPQDATSELKNKRKKEMNTYNLQKARQWTQHMRGEWGAQSEQNITDMQPEIGEWIDTKKQDYLEKMETLLSFSNKLPMLKQISNIGAITFVHVIYSMVRDTKQRMGLECLQNQVNEIQEVVEKCADTKHLVAFVKGTKNDGGNKYSIDAEELYPLLGHMCYFTATGVGRKNLKKNYPAGVVLMEYLITDDNIEWKVCNEYLSSFLSGANSTKRDKCMVCNKLGDSSRLLLNTQVSTNRENISTMLSAASTSSTSSTIWKSILTSKNVQLFMKKKKSKPRRPYHHKEFKDTLDSLALNAFVCRLKTKRLLLEQDKKTTLTSTTRTTTSIFDNSDSSVDRDIIT